MSNDIGNTSFPNIVHNQLAISTPRYKYISLMINLLQALNRSLMAVDLCEQLLRRSLSKVDFACLLLDINNFASLVSTGCHDIFILLDPKKVQNWVLVRLNNFQRLKNLRFVLLNQVSLLHVIRREIFVVHTLVKLDLVLVFGCFILWVRNNQFAFLACCCKNIRIRFWKPQAIQRASGD